MKTRQRKWRLQISTINTGLVALNITQKQYNTLMKYYKNAVAEANKGITEEDEGYVSCKTSEYSDNMSTTETTIFTDTQSDTSIFLLVITCKPGYHFKT